MTGIFEEEYITRVPKTKALISFAVTFVFAHADCWVSHGTAHLFLTLQISAKNHIYDQNI